MNKNNKEDFARNIDIKIKKEPLWKIKEDTVEYIYNEKNGQISKNKIKKDNRMNCWMVNHIRHNLCNYEEYLKALRKEPHYSEQRAYKALKRKALTKILKVYPELKKECKRQLFNIDYL